MNLKISLCTVLALATAVPLVAAQLTYTAITIPEMDCPSCAKEIVSHLQQVPGVGSVQVRVQDRVVFVLPQQGRTPSPRTLWENVEKAGYRPSRLDGPNGSHTSRPAN